MIDHFTVSVSNLAASREFYTRVLAPLGYFPLNDYVTIVGYGDTRPYFWVKEAPIATTPQHIAFMAMSRADVDAFHLEALAAGAKDDGAPGVREHYHKDYYGAFVIDPLNGHPIEAVCHFRPGGKKAVKAAAVARKRHGPAKRTKAPAKKKR